MGTVFLLVNVFKYPYSFCLSYSRDAPTISAPPHIATQKTRTRRTGAHAPVPHLLMPRPLTIDVDHKEPSSAPSSPTKSKKSPLRRLRSLPIQQKPGHDSKAVPRLRLHQG